MESFKLCYVDENWAYFTTQELSKQWGDDWNDKPYEHNAGQPYEHDENSDTPKYEIKKVAYDTDYYYSPSDMAVNSNYSVEGINKGLIPWLFKYDSSHPTIDKEDSIYAGESLEVFIEKVKKRGGRVYMEI